MLGSDEELKKLIDAYEVKDTLIKELSESGLTIIPKPKFDKIDNIDVTEDGEPVIPDDITVLSLNDLGTVYSMCNSYMNFITSQLAIVDMELKISAEIKDLVWSRIRQENEGTNSDKDDKVRQDARYIKANATYLLKKTKYGVVKEKHGQYENNLKLISRELSRRTLEMEQARIEGNFQIRQNYRPDGTGVISEPFAFRTKK